MTVRDSITRARARTPGAEDYPTSKAAHERALNSTQCEIIEVAMTCAKGGHKPSTSRCMPGAGLSRLVAGRCRSKCQPSSRIGENPPYGMIGRVEETSASFEARSAPRPYPTERGWETERWHRPQATAPILDSTDSDLRRCPLLRRCWEQSDVTTMFSRAYVT